MVNIQTIAQRLSPPSPLDTVIEIVNGNGTRFSNCIDPAIQNPPPPIVPDATPGLFDDPCLNDDIQIGDTTDSQLQFKVPGTTGQLVTFYVHVFDWYGGARPDYVYQIQITGAN